MLTYAYGYPRLGKHREFKKLIENFWNGGITETELLFGLDSLQEKMLGNYMRKVDSFPVGEMTLYDAMLDTAIIVGAFNKVKPHDYYNLCRGEDALEMKKWFDTNYHYLVPDLADITPDQLKLNWNKPAENYGKFHTGNPYILGPYTFLKLSKNADAEHFDEFLLRLSEIYFQICSEIPSVHIDEPALVFESTTLEMNLVKKTYERIAESGCKIHLFTYYDAVDDLSSLYDLPVSSLGLDLVHGKKNIDEILSHGFPEDIMLVAGVVDGRNVWRTDLKAAMELTDALSEKVPLISISNAGPLYHLPVSLEGESLDGNVNGELAFANERLDELFLIKQAAEKGCPVAECRPIVYGVDESVRRRTGSLKESDFKKEVSYSQRLQIQKERFNFPLLPCTSIGSFPQTHEVRSMRSEYRSGKIGKEVYDEFIRKKIKEVIDFQESVGLDVLVHGEFERTDMVEYFAEQLEGITTTNEGWVLSYGTRVYRPPIIYGDIKRVSQMTVDEIKFAQSLTNKPVKGMLTGPVTILSWSFVREDIPLENIAYQIALCLQDEIKDYEAAGIGIVQVDEPAFREKTPLKRREWRAYFKWATKAFNLATRSKPQTQIHTHMCYSEFGPVIDHVSELDFDVISIEASRKGKTIIREFEDASFTRQIGVGVWNIHSPIVPSVNQIKATIQNALDAISPEQLWINPDCGLKTRGWEETASSLKNMVMAVEGMRKEL